MQIEGYKALKSDYTNNYGLKFTKEKIYHIDGVITFGVNRNGFHFCRRMEDVFRYVYDAHLIVAQVTGFGTIQEGFDEYNGYYDMYVASDIIINNFLTREEVITYFLHANEMSVCRFLQTGYKLTEDEIIKYRKAYQQSRLINQYLDYYDLGDKETFNKEYIKRI